MSAKFPIAKLTDIAELNPTLGKKLPAEELVSFVPMASLSAESASVETTQDRPYAELAKGFTPFLDGDVLVAKITPCFENGKIAQARLPRSHGFGSTEFHVVRARSGVTESRYLHHYLRLEEVRTNGQRRMTGSGGQRRVPSNFLADLAIPLPPLEEQRRIAAILDQAETLRTQRRNALALLDSLTQSLFLDMFGDPVANPKGWPTSPLADASDEIQIGPFGSLLHQEDYVPDGIPLINPMHIKDGKIIPGLDQGITQQKYDELPIYQLKAGDLVMGRRGEMGRCAIVIAEHGPLMCGTGSLYIRPNATVATAPYLFHVLTSVSMKAKLEEFSLGATMPNLNKGIVAGLRVSLPPLPLQQTFATRIASIEALKATHRRALAALDALFASLQQRAFAGKLVASPAATQYMPAHKTVDNVEDLRTLEGALGLEALIFVAKRTAGNDVYAALKTLYIADKQHLEHHGRLIYGETYNALPMGPVPEAAYETIKFLRDPQQMFCSFGDSNVRAALRAEGSKRLTPLRDADLNKLGADAVQSLEAAIRYFANSDFGQVKTATHDSAYERTPPNQRIPVRYIIDMLPAEARQRHWNV